MEEESNRVLDLMTFWVSKIKAKNYQDLYDINRLSEDLALKLLNEIYNLNLENLNREKRNYPGIDLGDKTNKIAYQITSRDDPQKIKKSIEAFDKSFAWHQNAKTYILELTNSYYQIIIILWL
jgi:hypothetical protein